MPIDIMALEMPKKKREMEGPEMEMEEGEEMPSEELSLEAEMKPTDTMLAEISDEDLLAELEKRGLLSPK